jgi:hypothetical protein
VSEFRLVSILKLAQLRVYVRINPLNAELNPFRHMLALLQAYHILHVSRIRVKGNRGTQNAFTKVQDRQCKCNATLRRVSATIVAVENQSLFHVLSACL